MSLDAIPRLDPNATYEICPDCEDKGDGCCIRCWGEGLVPHICQDENPDWPELANYSDIDVQGRGHGG